MNCTIKELCLTTIDDIYSTYTYALFPSECIHHPSNRSEYYIRVSSHTNRSPDKEVVHHDEFKLKLRVALQGLGIDIARTF